MKRIIIGGVATRRVRGLDFYALPAAFFDLVRGFRFAHTSPTPQGRTVEESGGQKRDIQGGLFW
jgi:hypothetical protein